MRLRGDALLEPGTAARPTCPSKDWFSEGRPAIVSRPRSRTLWGRQRSTCVLLLATHHVTVAHSYFRDSNVRADRSTLPELDEGLMNPGVFASCRRPRGKILKSERGAVNTSCEFFIEFYIRRTPGSRQKTRFARSECQ